jgi:hypothetical protein
MRIQELVGREQIRDLVARYNASGDRGRIDQLVQLFAEDAVLQVGEQSYRGRAAIQAMFEEAARSTRERAGGQVRHFTATHQIEMLGDDEARGRCYFQVLTESGLDHWGRYLDEYRRIDGSWHFLLRRVELDGRVPGGWADRRLAPPR